MRTPASFLLWLSADTGLWSALPTGDAATAALGEREEPQSEEAWLQENTAVKQLLVKFSDSKVVTTTLDAIAEQAFRKALKATDHHQLAAQVADDLRLLAEATVAGYESPTLDRLWEAYSSGRFPDRVT